MTITSLYVYIHIYIFFELIFHNRIWNTALAKKLLLTGSYRYRSRSAASKLNLPLEVIYSNK